MGRFFLISRYMKLYVLVMTLGCAGIANGAQITTTFSSDNGFAGNMFDVTTIDNYIRLTGLSINVSGDAGIDVGIDVYIKYGSYVGFESDASAWTLVSRTIVVSAGQDNSTFVDVTDYMFDSGAVYGVYITLNPAPIDETTTQIRYTNGSNTYSNADLQLDAGAGIGGLFGANGIFGSRTWNGSINYEVAEAPIQSGLNLILIKAALDAK
jgi:hypothetical protein